MEKHLRRQNFHIVFLKSACLNIVLMSFGGCDHHQNVVEEENKYLQALLLKIRTVFQAVCRDLPKLGVDITKDTFYKCFYLTMETDGVLSSILERLELLNPDIRQLYDLISSNSSPTFVKGLNHETVTENINLLIIHIEELRMHRLEEVAPLNKDLESTRNSLLFLRNFLGFTSKRSSKQLGMFTGLVNHVDFMVRNISCLLYLCPLHINDPMVNDWKRQFSAELLNFSPEQAATREVYIKALEASKSSLGDSNAAVDEFDFQFLKSIGDSILELSDNNLSFMASNKDHILSLHKELQFLTIGFAMSDPSTSYTVRFGPKSAELDHIIHISNYFQKHISAIIIDMSCLIYTLYNNEQNMKRRANELKVAVTALQDTMKTAQENARKEYEPYMPKSWRMKTKFRNADAKGTILFLTRTWEKSNSYISGETRDYRPFSNYVFSAFQEEVHSLIGTFRNLIAKQHFVVEELQITQVGDMRTKTECLFSSNPLDSWGFNFMVFLLIEDIKKIKREFEDLQSQIMQESKVNSINTSVNVRVGGIEDHESNLDLLCPQKDEVDAHRLKEALLEVFLRCKGKKHSEDGELRVLLTSICSGSNLTDQELQRLFSYSNIQISPKKGISDDDDEVLMESLKALLQNIEVLLKCHNELVDPVKKELEAAQKGLRYLRNFIGFTSKSCGEPQKLKDLLFHTEFLVCKISFLLSLCCDIEKMSNYQIVNEIKMHLSSDLQKFSPALPDVRDIYIRSLKASKLAKATSDSAKLNEYVLGFLDSLREDALKLFNNNLSHTASKDKDQVLSLQEELKFLITFFTANKSLEGHSENIQISNSVFECIKAVIIDIGCVIYSLNNDMNNENSFDVFVLVANFMAAKAGIREIYDSYVPRPLWSDFPRTNGQGFVDTLLWRLNELSSTKDGLVAPLKHNIEIVKEELLALWKYFIETAKESSHSEELQNQWSSFLDTAYQTEYVIDSFLAEDCHLYRYKLGLFNVIEDIKRIKTEIKAIEIKKTNETSVQKSSCFPAQILVEESDLPKQNVVISSKERQADEKSTTELLIFEEEAKSIREKLTNGSGKLSIISIVGMGGIGKTTLADSVFQHSSVTHHFHDVMARCTVSQVHDRRRLLLEILKQLNIPCSENDDELDRKLYQSLKGRRYLILMDDVWDIRPWQDLRASFPDDSNGSRIIFTSRSHDIAALTGLERNVYQLLPLSEEKSWGMLRVKLFGSESCPTELVSVGREIAANCRGLPLTIDLVAGVIRGKEREEWKNVAKCLMTILFKDPEGRCQEVLELSYKNLPDDMKPCFLYFAAFPEDDIVSTETLISLWIAEGFVQQEKGGESRRLEDVANDILKKLINRSLITVSRETPLGEVTATRVHDLLHEFAVAKAKAENFIDVHCDQQRDPYRLCIYPENWESFLRSNPSGPRTRSIVCNYRSFVFDNVSLNLSTFKLLRVLYIPNGNSCRYHPEMLRLIHLRVLVIGGSSCSTISSIMAKIHKFRNLEYFMMSGEVERKSVDLLLDKICKMERLRSFYFSGFISFKYRSEKIWDMSSLFNNLQTLSHLEVSYEEDIEKILKLMPNLVNLVAKFYNPYDEDDQLFPKLEFLDKLESLKVKHEGGYGIGTCTMDEICFPRHLKTLVLSSFRFPWTEIRKLGNLQFLETLKLKKDAFEGPIWDMIDGQFPNLKQLSLFHLDIQEWNASRDHLPSLQLLHVSGCEELEELPSCLAEIETLQRIKVVYCKDSVVNSAKRIKEEQDEIRDEEFDVEIIQSLSPNSSYANLIELL